MAELIKRLPFDIVYHCILPYLDSRFSNVQFKVLYTEENSDRYFNHNYSKKFETALDGFGALFRKSILGDCYVMLSRIKKKNNKHRYYLTVEKVVMNYISCDCKNYHCRDWNCGVMETEAYYSSTFIGKDLAQAILCWYSISETTPKNELIKSKKTNNKNQ